MSADDSIFRNARWRRWRAALVQGVSGAFGLVVAVPLVAYGLFPPPRDPMSADPYFPLFWLIAGFAVSITSLAMLVSAYRSWRHW